MAGEDCYPSVIWNFRFFGVSLQPFRAISSVGLEHLPYKQGVDGSNPPSPTTDMGVFWF